MLGQIGGFVFVVNPRSAVDVCLELSVRHQIGIAANGRGEVDVSIQIEAKVASVLFAVAGPLHQLEEALVNDAPRGLRQVTGGGLSLLKRGENTVSCFRVDDASKVREHRFLGGL